jgi:RimJ/RimL family protein N-acetyltransferase
VTDVRLELWSAGDLSLLQRLLGDPAMMIHLGGPETPEQILRRHQRYSRLTESSTDHMFKIVREPGGEGVGSVGYWRKVWREQQVYEMGWLVLPEYQGQGVGTRAAEAVIAEARRKPKFRFMHAFPSVANAASNAICRKLGFTLVEECQFEYPAGRSMRVNDWRLDLFEERAKE